MSFPKYEDCIDVAANWLGSVPRHWAVQALKRHVRLLTEKTDRREHPVALENIESWTGRFIHTDTEFEGEGVAFESGDILFGKLRPYLAKALVTESSGEAVGDFLVLRPAPAAVPQFVAYQMRSREFISIVDGSTYGSKMPRASWEFVGSLQVTLPPRREQIMIANFLDRETAKIDALVDEQKRLIELLKEKRQAVISQAVTKGLDPNVSMKDSGHEWSTLIPSHWTVATIKHFCKTITDGAHISPETENGIHCFVSTKDVRDEQVDFENCLRTSDATYELMVRTGCRPIVGDVLFSKDGTIGRTVVVSDTRDFVVASSLIIIRPDTAVLAPAFLNFLCQSRLVSNQVEGFVKGAGLPRLSIQNLLKVVGVFPPLSEQIAISSFLRSEKHKIDKLIAEADIAIDLLQERRSALISAAVTGNIDVRGLVPQPEPVAA